MCLNSRRFLLAHFCSPPRSLWTPAHPLGYRPAPAPVWWDTRLPSHAPFMWAPISGVRSLPGCSCPEQQRCCWPVLPWR